MRYLLSLVILIACGVTTASAQNFSLIDDPAPSDNVTISSEPVLAGPLSSTVTPISIILTDFAEVRDVEGGKKAVFLSQDGLVTYNGVLVKITSKINNPLLRIYKKPDFFPPAVMKRYSANEWFYYGDAGAYIIEVLDVVDGNWTSEFIEAKIVKGPDGGGGDGPGDGGGDGPGDGGGDDDYAKIRSETAKDVKALNDPDVANALIREYTKVLSNLSGSIDEMRNQVREARRAAFQSVKVRNANWNTLLLKVDQMMIDQGVDTPDEYKSAIKSYVDGIGDGLK